MVLDAIQMMWLLFLKTPMQLECGKKSRGNPGSLRCKERKGREVTLTIGEEVGRPIYAVCTWSSGEHDQDFSKTARAIEMRLFDGDVSIERYS